MLRDEHAIIVRYLNLSREDSKLKEIVLRKPRHDPYTLKYTRSLGRLAQVENLV